MELLTAAQMRAIEQAAIDSAEVTGLELMERAGRGVVEAVFEEWPALGEGAHQAVVLCGPGNNGGDGFVVARLLSEEHGWVVDVFLYGDAEALPPDARVNYDRWCAVGEVRSTASLTEWLAFPNLDVDVPSCDLFVDAAFGTGLSRPLPAELVDVAGKFNDREETDRGWIVAVDLPSGLCSDSGRILGSDPDAVISADLTVTFHGPKLGHHLAEGPDWCRKLVVKDIGL